MYKGIITTAERLLIVKQLTSWSQGWSWPVWWEVQYFLGRWHIYLRLYPGVQQLPWQPFHNRLWFELDVYHGLGAFLPFPTTHQRGLKTKPNIILEKNDIYLRQFYWCFLKLHGNIINSTLHVILFFFNFFPKFGIKICENPSFQSFPSDL